MIRVDKQRLPLYVGLGSVFLLILLPTVILPTYEKTRLGGSKGSSCSQSFCYDSSSSTESLCTPDKWTFIPCAWGVENECASTVNQSPIELDPNGYGNSNCVSEAYSDNYSNNAKTTNDKGTCTFDQLTSFVNKYQSTQTYFPSRCTKPSLTFGGSASTTSDVLLSEGVESDVWELNQLIIHTGGSEHILKGTRYDGEIQLVHKSRTSGKTLVVGIMLSTFSSDDDGNNDDGNNDDGNNDDGNNDDGNNDDGNNDDGNNDDSQSSGNDFSSTLEPLLVAYETAAEKSSCRKDSAAISHGKISYSTENWNVYNLLPESATDNYVNAATGAYIYTGSLTTPPCTSGVIWYVTDTPMKVSSDQMSRLESAVSGYADVCDDSRSTEYLGSYRPSQNLGSREVDHYCVF